MGHSARAESKFHGLKSEADGMYRGCFGEPPLFFSRQYSPDREPRASLPLSCACAPHAATVFVALNSAISCRSESSEFREPPTMSISTSRALHITLGLVATKA